MIEEKKKILVIADSPLAPSGVGTQTKYMIEAMLKTGEYKFLCLAGAIKHRDYRTQKVDPWGDDWLIKPTDGYGDPNTIRAILRDYRPDILWFMTDPRFYSWLWEIEDEVRSCIPMVYYHVWDNYPYPDFNKSFYDSNDVVCTISKVTDDIVRTVSPEVECVHLPHTVNTDIFRKSTPEAIKKTRDLITNGTDKKIFFWNNRNARRKQSGTLIFWFKEFLDKVGHNNACLVMHTEPDDPHGQDLEAIIKNLDLANGQVILSTVKLPPEELAKIYSSSDCTINISDAEGFGLGTLESLACETPILVNMTGGLQEQVTDGENWFGIGLNPCSKAVIGSQDVPYIYEDRLNKEQFIDAMKEIFEKTPEELKALGQAGREHVLNNYGFEQYSERWKKVFDSVTKNYGSWDNRKKHKRWEFKEIK